MMGAYVYDFTSADSDEYCDGITAAISRVMKIAWISPCAGYYGNRYPAKRWVCDIPHVRKLRYFRNRRKAERWARRYTQNVRHL